MTATMPLTVADKIYTNTIQELRGFIETHLNEELYGKDRQGNFIQGTAAFCRAYEIDRSNLVKCLQGQREMSVGLYQRIAAALGLIARDQVCGEAMLFNVPLRMYLTLNHDAIKNSMMIINFS